MKISRIAILVMAVLLLAGCRKGRKTIQLDANFPSDAVPTDVRIVERTNTLRLQVPSVSSKVNLTLAMGEKEAAVSGLVLTVFFTIVSIFLLVFDPIKDCGCFGQAVTLTHWETFIKNIVLLLCIIPISKFPKFAFSC